MTDAATPYPRPHVVIDPAVAYGAATIRGVPTGAVAGMVRAGETLATVADEYDLTLCEVILACWFEGTHGRYRKQWKAWADAVALGLGGWNPFDPDTVQGPPAKP